MDALFNIAGVYVAEDPQRFYEQTVSMYQRMVQVMNKAVEAEEAGMAPKAYFEPNAATLDGSPVSKFGFEMPEGMAGGMGGMGGMGMPMNPMLSPEAMTYWIAPAEAGMLFAMGPDHNTLKMVKRTAGDRGELTARAAIAAGREALPADRFSELHFDIAGMVKHMMNAMMGQMGGGGPQIPDLPPVSVALSSEAGGGAVYTHVPTEMIRGAVQAWMGMQMGGPGGPGGPMPPGVEVVPPQGGFEAEPDEAEPMGEGGGAPAGRAEVIEVTDADWAGEVLEAEGPVLVELYADWSDPALRQQPITDALADQFAGRVKVVRVDIDANPQIVERLQPKTIPTLVILDGGQTVETFEGPIARSTLVAALEKVAE
jgi:thiol-disulfide isomerase/thioredoxin